MTLQFKITNMACAACANRVTKAIKSIDTNASVQTNTKTKLVSIQTQVSESVIKEALAAIGYLAA
ncbi:heavy-metal-associated domain-containing protein [Nostoc sp. FACHB-110]|uniref:heavy-metal-associated domain-containing protein n=1 Tax=Nostoc sp. FACHB-110 TaxID=2692834 RepID=UPI001689FE48|nr:heavy-metal-associated domain-containing protein [Nostoc sp. FACHB-110]MBD2435911.1 heavy-metal-associated domain-containing protein [Nostoc sp. FACHB-110]